MQLSGKTHVFLSINKKIDNYVYNQFWTFENKILKNRHNLKFLSVKMSA